MNAACPLGDLGGGAGFGEILLVFAAVLVLFGPRKLPEFARTLGRILEGLRKASAEFREQVMRLDEPPSPPPRRADDRCAEPAPASGRAEPAACDYAGDSQDRSASGAGAPAPGGPD